MAGRILRIRISDQEKAILKFLEEAGPGGQSEAVREAIRLCAEKDPVEQRLDRIIKLLEDLKQKP